METIPTINEGSQVGENATTKDKVIQMAADTWIGHRQTFLRLRQRFQYMLSRYENKLREGSITEMGQVKATLGGAFSLVENALPRILGNDPKYKYLGRETDDVEGANIYESFSEWQYDEAGVRSELEEIAKWGLITGLSGFKMGWKKEVQLVDKAGKEVMGFAVTNPMALNAIKTLGLSKKLKDTTVSEEKTTQNYTVTAIKPFDLIWNPTARKYKDVNVFGFKSKKLLQVLKDEGYDIEPLRGSFRTKDIDQIRMDNQESLPTQERISVFEEQEADVAELYVKFPENGVLKSFVVTLGQLSGGNPVCIGFMDNPLEKKFTPMSIFTPIVRVGKFYGFGLIEPSVGVLDAEEDAFNMFLEATWTNVSPPIEYNPANIVDQEYLEYGARKLVPVRRLGESMNVMPTPQVPTQSFSFSADFLSRAKQNISGITDYQTGADQQGGQKTLGEIKLKTNESNARIGQILGNFERQVIEPIGRFALMMNKQYLRDEKELIFRVVGRKGELAEKKIAFDDIDAIKDIVVVTGATALSEQQERLAFWSALIDKANLEEQSMNPVKINKLPMWEKLIEEGGQLKDPETYLPSLKELEQQEVGDNMAQLKDAMSENANPLIATVLPTDNADLHIQLHQAEIKKRQTEHDMATQVGISVPEEVVMELQMLVKHMNDHTLASGGPVADHVTNMQVGQQADPNEPKQ
jgi:hypothetical protein